MRFVRLLLYTISKVKQFSFQSDSKHKEFPNANSSQLKEIAHLKNLCSEAMDYLEVLHKRIKADRGATSETSENQKEESNVTLSNSNDSNGSTSLKDSYFTFHYFITDKEETILGFLKVQPILQM